MPQFLSSVNWTQDGTGARDSIPCVVTSVLPLPLAGLENEWLAPGRNKPGCGWEFGWEARAWAQDVLGRKPVLAVTQSPGI